MVQLLLTKFWVLAHLLVTAGTLCFFPESAGLALWAAVASFMALLLLPPVHTDEGFFSARTRAWHALRRDAFFYASLLAVTYLGIQLLNAPRLLTFDPELKRWVFAAAPLPLFPSSLAGEGAGHWAGLIGGLTAAVAVRTVLPRRQRVLLLTGLALLVGAVGTLIALAPGDFSDALLAGCGGASVWALAAFLMGCVAMGLAVGSFLEGHRVSLVFTLVALFLDFAALAAMAFHALWLAVALVLAVWIVFVPVAVRLSARFPRMVWMLVLLLPPLAGAALGLVADGALEPLLALFEPSSLSEPMAAFWEQWGFRCGLATQVFGANPMLGIGPEGFGEVARFFVKGRAEWALWNAGGTGVPCDFMLLLAEQGMMGTLLLLLPGATLIGSLLMGSAEVLQDRRGHYSYRYVFVLFGSLLGVIGVLLFSLIGNPLHAPLTLCVFLTVCACMTGWLPRRR